MKASTSIGNGAETATPYLYEYYNVFAFMQIASSGVRSILARLLNSLIEGLNERQWLPRFLIIFLDMDLIDEINVWFPENAMVKAFNMVLCWLVRQVNMLIRRRCLEISDVMPGAVFGDDPRVIFIKTLRRYDYYSWDSQLGKICAAQAKFNNGINAVAVKQGYKVMNVSVCDRAEHFDVCGNLSETGK